MNIFDDSESSESFESPDHDSSFSTGIKGPELLEWTSNGQAEKWREKVEKRLQADLKIAILCNAKDEEKQPHREIRVYQYFIQLEYFEALEKYPEITAQLTKDEITKAANDSSRLDCSGDLDSFPPNQSFSPISIDLASVFDSYSSKKLKKLFQKKKKKTRKGPDSYTTKQHTPRSNKCLRNQQTDYQKSNSRKKDYSWIPRKRHTVDVRRKNGTSSTCESVRRIKNFISTENAEEKNRVIVSKKKVMLELLKSIGEAGFWNDDQERHWNFNAIVFFNWFKLYDWICRKHGIANGNIYNMD